MSDDDAAENFFFAPVATRAEDAALPAPSAAAQQSELAPRSAADAARAEEGADAPALARLRAVVARLAPSDVFASAAALEDLAQRAPAAVATLEPTRGATVAARGPQELPRMTAMDLRRQQAALLEIASGVATPLRLALARWDEDVERNVGDLVAALRGAALAADTTDAATLAALLARVSGERDVAGAAAGLAERLVAALGRGRAGAALARRASARLSLLVDERRRELRLVEDLMAVAVW
jgi:hypothetical protein